MAYAEREPVRLAGADLWLAGLGYRWQRIFGARRRGGALAAEVARRARALGDAELPPLLPALRYRLRRDAAADETLLDAFALYCAALARTGLAEIPPEAIAAALWVSRGGIAALANRAMREQALALAAFALSVRGPAVHLLTASDAAARELAGTLQPAFAALGLAVGMVENRMDGAARRRGYAQPLVCVAHREAGLDYLRDRALRGGRPGGLRAHLEALGSHRLDGSAGTRERLLLPGLHCALVADADAVMLDDARAPLVIAREAGASGERLVYEQAMELARALRPGADFSVDEAGATLEEDASGLLERLVTPLGGVWAAREAREGLVRLALEALHVLERDQDYRVERGRVLLPARPPEEAEAAAAGDEMRKAMLEVKEGCRSGERREVVARLTVPEFLGRYVHLGGLCADARGLEGDFWALYRAKTASAGALPPATRTRARVFASAAAKQAALASAPPGALIIVRTEKEGQALAGALASAEARRVVLYPPPADAQPAALFVAELLDSRRHLEQLRARFPGTPCEVLVSIADEPLAGQLGPFSRAAGRVLSGRAQELPAWAATLFAALAQRRVERAHALARLELVSRQHMLNELLAFSGPAE